VAIAIRVEFHATSWVKTHRSTQGESTPELPAKQWDSEVQRMTKPPVFTN